jgi:DNA-binding NtrC family response regulator
MKKVLVVDDKDMMRDSVAATLQRASFAVSSVESGEAALAQIAIKRPDCVVTDMKMPGIGGLELLERIRQIDDDLPVIVMTAFGTIDTAVRAMKTGAFDYLTKPFEGDELIIAVKRAIDHARLVRENALLRAGDQSCKGIEAGAGPRGVNRLIGSSDAMKELRDQVAAISGSHGNVLITGESGSGKEVVARALHEAGPRGVGAFLGVNCAALSASLLESELFGHERGAFTGADKLRKGRFELADGGTLLLDEVSEVSPQVQAKLLRVLQERSFERVGSSVSIGVDVRVMATSNRDLPSEVAKNAFRSDLYFRLNVLPVAVPPLRERLADVRELAAHFVGLISLREGREPMAIEPDAVRLMENYAWPGNVRELQNICERAVVLATAHKLSAITPGLLRPWLTGTLMSPQPATPIPLSASTFEPKPSTAAGMSHPENVTLEEIEREAIVSMLRRYNGHRQKTARALGIGVRTLGLKLKKWKQQKLVADTL